MILRFHSFQFLYICCIYSSEDIENYLNYLKFIKIAINKFFKKKKKGIIRFFFWKAEDSSSGVRSHFASRCIFFAILQPFLALAKRKSISVSPSIFGRKVS